MIMYSYCYVFYVLCILFHCVVLCIVCLYLLLPPDVKPIAVNSYIISYINFIARITFSVNHFSNTFCCVCMPFSRSDIHPSKAAANRAQKMIRRY